MKKIYTFLLGLFLCQVSIAQIQFNISDESGDAGDQVSVDVRVTDFVDVASVLFSINWDPNVAEFNSVTNLSQTLPGFDLSFFGTPEQPTIDEGELAVSWSLPNTSNFTIEEDNHLLFTLVLDLTGQDCAETIVNLSGDPRPIEFSDDQGSIYDVTSNDGSASINGAGCGSGSSDIDFFISDETSMSGGNVCFEITVDNFTNISLAQIAVTWDPTKLANASIQNEGLSGAISVFNEADGSVRYLWQDGTLENPVTLSNGTVLFDICYDVIASSGTNTCINIEDLPNGVPPFSVTFVDFDENELPYTVDNGCVTVQGGSTDVTFYYDDQELTLGANNCIAVKTRNFENLQTFQFAMEFDPNELMYTGPGFLNPALPITAGQISLIGDNNLRVSWNDVTGFGVDIDNDETLFEVCFDTAGDCDQSTELTFTGNLVPGGIEVTDVNNNILPFVFTKGDLTIVCPCNISLVDGQWNDVSCNGGNDGKLTVIADGGNGNYTYDWGSDGTGPMISNLEAGTYTVSVSDGEVCNTVVSFQIDEPSIITIGGTTTNETTDCNGTITTSVSGGTAGYSFSWNDGGTTPNRDGLCKGDYTVTVTDSNGCTNSNTFSIAPKPIQVDDVTINDVSCFGGNDGSIDIAISGGCEPYTISPVITDLPVGSYTITITDASTPPNTITQTYPIDQPDPIVINLVSITNTDSSINGAIDVTVSGGTGDYTYLWTPSGAITEDLSGVGTGDYTLVVTDDNGCTASSESYSISTSEIVVEFTVPETNGFQIDCNGNCSGSISANVLAANGVVSYTLNDEVVSLPIDDLCAGVYTIVYTDENGLSDSEMFSITEPEALSAMIGEVSEECENNTRSANVLVMGGVADYTYDWSGSTEDSDMVSGLEGGDNTVLVTDMNNCQFLVNFTVVNCEPVGTCYEGSPIITPNADGANDEFVISCNSNPDNTLYIYDRYGRTVFTQTNYDNTWTGLDTQGADLPENGYMWVLEVISSEGIREVYKGTVTILRNRY